ncbi:MAG TPA: pyridoxal-dependent decarboxylase, partial [Candidatus Acidoferrales bacterium]|nr:pyridoxal-dependent decarboxylase [Candidatus Acidoferrales bacterium]
MQAEQARATFYVRSGMDQWAADRVMAFQAGKNITTASPDVELERPLSSRMLSPITQQEYLEWILDSVLPKCINMRSPRCLAHMANSVPEFISTLAQVLIPLNQNMAKRQASRAFSRLEEDAIIELHKLVYGFPAGFYAHHRADESAAFGLMVGGGTLANMTAIWTARNRCFGPMPGFAGIEEEGAAEAFRAHGYAGAAVVGSELMHYSFDKAMGMAGLGTRALSKVPADVDGRIAVHDAEERIAEMESAKRKVFALVAIAGTTDCGSIDPLEKLGELARRRGIHYHVDAAWGAPLLFSRRSRGLLRGIELADTVTIDGHKQFHLPIGTSLLLFRDPRMAAVIRKRASYMLQEGTRDLGSHSPEGSRSAASVYLHAALSI